jgi:predicted transposase/invertase (TIGR01784 family)
MPRPVHDVLVKYTFEDPERARGELASMLPPKVVALVDWDTLQVEKGSFVDAALRSRITDLLFSVKLAGRDARLYLLFEHQSTADPFMPFRVLVYETRIWEAWRKLHPEEQRLPPIVPIVLAQVDGGWKVATELVDVIDFANAEEREALAPLMPRLSLLVDDLAQLTDEKLQARPLLETTRLALAALQHVRNRQTLAELVGRLARWITQLPDDERSREMLRTVIAYTAANRSDTSVEEIQAAVATVAPEVEDKVMTTLSELEARGEARGIALGEARAEARAKQATLGAVLLKLLALRFGTVSDDARATIVAAEVATLERWVDRVLTAPSVEAVLAD